MSRSGTRNPQINTLLLPITKAGKWYLAQIRPARTLGYSGDVVRGPHYLFCDKSEKKAEEALAAQRQWEADAWMFMDPEERHYARQERLEAEYEEESK